MTSLTLRVSPSHLPDVQRTIELSGRHSLEDLHSAIQRAYHFDDDHSYAFFLNGHAWDQEFGYWSAPSTDAKKDVSATLDSLNLRQNKRFLYLFDYGDEHHFDVRVRHIDPLAAGPATPSVIEAIGEGPEQYDDDDEELEDHACGHDEPDPELAALAHRLEPAVRHWSEVIDAASYDPDDDLDDDLDDEDLDDEDLDDDLDDEETAEHRDSDAPSPYTLAQEFELALQVLDACHDDFNEVHRNIEHVIEADVFGWLAHLADRLSEGGEHDLAVRLTERLIAAQPTPEIKADLPRLLALAGRHDEARSLLEALAVEEPDDAFIALHAGGAWRALGDESRAEAAYRDALRFAGSDTWLRDQSAEELVDLLNASGRHDDAAKLLEAEAVAQAARRRQLTALESDPAPVLQAQPVRAEVKPGRNDPCTCGSGKKYKKCCGQS